MKILAVLSTLRLPGSLYPGITVRLWDATPVTEVGLGKAASTRIEVPWLISDRDLMGILGWSLWHKLDDI